ncbi:hypothetical protein EMMF5_000756 [Cystobasidiomycetes sp. EMM_F5]
MDQNAFRSMLAAPRVSAPSSSSLSAHNALGAGSRKRRNDGSSVGWLGGDGSKAAASHSSSDANHFKPRGQQGKASAEPTSSLAAPSYKRFGYVDRAAMRRAGLLDEDTVEPGFRGLNPLLLATPNEPVKTEEEVEQELEQAERDLQYSVEASDEKADPVEAEKAPKLISNQPKSRAEKLRELQARIAAASSGADPSPPPPVENARPTATASLAKQPEPTNVPKGFKVVQAKPKKKKAKQGDADAAPITESLNGSSVKPASAANGNTAGLENTAGDDEFDLFAGVGEYKGDLSDEGDDDGEEGEVQGEKPADTAQDQKSERREKYFDDEENLIPKFQAYRSPTPPPREERQGGHRNPYATESGGNEINRPQRLEGLSASGRQGGLSARELLELDDEAAREEKRRLRKLKGKDRKEANEREAELSGKASSEQKAKDRLNREVQEYEKYEQKKKARTDR